MNNGLLICPDCLEQNRRNILGSVTPEGNLSIMRTNHSTTIIISQDMMIACQCGFGTILNRKEIVTYQNHL